MADLQSAALATWLRSRIVLRQETSSPGERYGSLGGLVKAYRL